MNPLGFEELAEFLIIFASFVEHDYTTNMLVEIRSSEKKFPVGSSIFESILNADCVKSLADSPCTFISGQDTFAGGANVLSGLNKLRFEFTTGV